MNFIFVIGVGRSGTSLLQSMIGSNDQVWALPETGFLRRLAFSGAIDKAYKKGGADQVLTLMQSDSKVQRFGLSMDRLKDCIELAVESTVGTLGIRVYTELVRSHASASKDGTLYILDKDPRLIEYLSVLDTCFPRCRIISILRDPRDVLSSKKKAAWSARSSSWKHVFANRVQFMLERSAIESLASAVRSELRYEDLLSRPEASLLAVCTEVGICYEVSMLNFSREASLLVNPEEMQWKKETLGPLLGDNIGKWRGELTAREVILCEVLCSSIFRYAKYSRSLSYRDLSRLDQVYVGASLIFCWSLTPVYMVYRRFRNFGNR